MTKIYSSHMLEPSKSSSAVVAEEADASNLDPRREDVLKASWREALQTAVEERDISQNISSDPRV